MDPKIETLNHKPINPKMLYSLKFTLFLSFFLFSNKVRICWVLMNIHPENELARENNKPWFSIIYINPKFQNSNRGKKENNWSASENETRMAKEEESLKKSRKETKKQKWGSHRSWEIWTCGLSQVSRLRPTHFRVSSFFI